MEQAEPSSPSLAPASRRAAAFGVHIFTALGAGVALLALLEAVREHWSAMFAWLGMALVIDAADGPMARRLDVVRLQPNWSGDILDLVVDFVTYVFVPAYAITASRLLLPVAAPLLGIGVAVSGALYFADRRMKSDDNHFRGFPGPVERRRVLPVSAALASRTLQPCHCPLDRRDFLAVPGAAPAARRAVALVDVDADGGVGRADDLHAGAGFRR